MPWGFELFATLLVILTGALRSCVMPIGVQSLKRKITKAKPNGYRSYHLILDVNENYQDVDGQNPGHFYVEIQLRTIAMDSWASLEHEIKYKHQIKNPERIGKELKRCADQLASCDIQMETIRQLIQED